MGRIGFIAILPVKRYGDGDGVAWCEWAFTLYTGISDANFMRALCTFKL